MSNWDSGRERTFGIVFEWSTSQTWNDDWKFTLCDTWNDELYQRMKRKKNFVLPLIKCTTRVWFKVLASSPFTWNKQTNKYFFLPSLFLFFIVGKINKNKTNQIKPETWVWILLYWRTTSSLHCSNFIWRDAKK